MAARKRVSRQGLGDASALRCDGSEIYISRESLTREGYTRAGRYFGTGEKLWSYSNDSSSGYLRAPDKAAAKRLLTKKCPTSALRGVTLAGARTKAKAKAAKKRAASKTARKAPSKTARIRRRK